MIFEEQFLVPRYTAASKMGNSVISLLCQLRCRCNPDHNKFPSSFNTTVVAIFPKLCLWRRSLCSNLGGIDPEKLYRATLKLMANRGNELDIRNFELDLTISPWARKLINFHLFQIAVYSTLFVTGFQ